MLVQKLPQLGGVIRWNILHIPRGVQRSGRVTWTEFIGTRRFQFRLEWNELGKFWVLSIWHNDTELVRSALQYGWDFLESFQHIPELSGIVLIPFDPGLACMEEGITRHNLGREVQLFWVLHDS